jgi:hypothetical protein
MRKALIEQIGGEIDRAHIPHDPLSKTEPFEIGRVSFNGYPGVRSAIDIIKEYFWKPAPGEALIVLKRDGTTEFHAKPPEDYL